MANDIIERLGKIECGCERADALRDSGMDRDAIVRELRKLGFGRNGQAVPTDWASYYHTDELREFVLEYAETYSPAA